MAAPTRPNNKTTFMGSYPAPVIISGSMTSFSILYNIRRFKLMRAMWFMPSSSAAGVNEASVDPALLRSRRV